MHGLVLLRLYTLDSRKSQTCDLVADKGRHVVRGTRGRSGVEAANSACGTYARCARARRDTYVRPLSAYVILPPSDAPEAAWRHG